MQATLMAVAGPGVNTVVVISGCEEVMFGRDSANQIVLEDSGVSRLHCVVSGRAAGCVVRDLNSKTGTWVNGESVNERVLRHGDRITIGKTVFIVAESYAEPHCPSGAELTDDCPSPDGHDLALVTDAGSKSTNQVLLRLARDIQQLTKVATKIGGIHDVDALLTQVIWVLFEVLPVDRCAVVLLDESNQEIRASAGWNKLSPTQAVRVSRTVLRRVLDTKRGTITHDVQSDEELRTSQTFKVSGIGVRSVICAPLKLGERVLGAIYGELLDQRLRLDYEHLEMASGIAAMTALQLQHVERIQALGLENERLRARLGFDHGIIGSSAAMTDVMTKIAKLAATDSTVLIEGETGTGKELVARAIHADSNRAAKPFIAVNCAALTETLLESELFGYEKGAFTGAATRKRGLFEAADGGCIFLDEIGELAPAMQAKLLRVLQQREFVRVGGTQATKVNVRVIAATNRDLRLMAKSGGFREDLFFRLSVVRIVLPPLRQRCDDIPALALHFLEKHARLCNRRVNGISRVVNEYLLRYSWPGNIRELENAIERAVVLGSGETILPEDLPETVLEQNTSEKGTGSSAVPNFHRAVLECKRELILKAVTQANGNLSEAARRLGLHPNYLHRLVTAMNLRTELIPKAAE